MTSPLRITHRAPSDAVRGLEAAPAPPAADIKEYTGRLVKMIPSEVISLYLVGSGLIPPENTTPLWIWSAVCLVGCVTFRAFATSDPEAGKGPQWLAVALSSVAFVIWVYSLGGPFAALQVYTAYVGSLLILAYTFFVPLFYKGEEA